MLVPPSNRRASYPREGGLPTPFKQIKRLVNSFLHYLDPSCRLRRGLAYPGWNRGQRRALDHRNVKDRKSFGHPTPHAPRAWPDVTRAQDLLCALCLTCVGRPLHEPPSSGPAHPPPRRGWASGAARPSGQYISCKEKFLCRIADTEPRQSPTTGSALTLQTQRAEAARPSNGHHAEQGLGCAKGARPTLNVVAGHAIR